MGLDLNVPDLGFDMKPCFVPKSIRDFIGELSMIASVAERARRIDDFVGRLEEEMGKIEAFKSELPLCMLITKDAISYLKEELAKFGKRRAEPILEEFIPLKKRCCNNEKLVGDKVENETRGKMKSMSSFQLWNPNDLKNRGLDSNFSEKTNTMKVKEVRRANETTVMELSLMSPRIDLCDFNSNKSIREISGSTHSSQLNSEGATHQQKGRKQRRCWSPELHGLFVTALEKLGGPEVATPKAIRNLMQVDGLTNDEVKSHLQKYRLHFKHIPTSAATSSSNQSSID